MIFYDFRVCVELIFGYILNYFRFVVVRLVWRRFKFGFLVSCYFFLVDGLEMVFCNFGIYLYIFYFIVNM